MMPTKFLPAWRSRPACGPIAAALLVGGALLTLGGTLHAQTTYLFTGASTTAPNALNDASNYSPAGTLPGSSGANDTVLFNSSGAGGGTTALTLTNTTANLGGASGTPGVLFSFDGTQTGTVNVANAATIRLSGVTVSSGAAAMTFSGTGGYNVGGLTTATTNAFTNNSANTLTISGNLQAGGSGTRTLDFAGTGTGSINVSGAIGTTAANIALQKDSSALLTLSGANAYTGATTLNAGITRITNSTALGAATGGAVTVASGATLQLSNASGLAVGAKALTISGAGATGGTGALENNSGANSYAGAVTLAANSTVAVDTGTALNLTSTTAVAGSGFNLTLAGSGTGTVTGGVATGAGGLNKSGAGTWTLNGASTYTGATAISGGTLLVNGSTGSSAVAVTGGGSTLGGTGTVGGVVTVNSGAVLQGGAGTVTGTLTLTATPVLSAGSIIGLTLGANGTHSTLALPTGFNGFQTNQAFTLSGLQTGTYDNLITGVASGITTSGWTITNGSGYSYAFTDDGSNIDLTVTAVPEPSTWMAGALCIAAGVGAWRRRQTAC